MTFIQISIYFYIFVCCMCMLCACASQIYNFSSLWKINVHFDKVGIFWRHSWDEGFTPALNYIGRNYDITFY